MDVMETINASDAKREFGELLLKAQQQPIAINRNGKPAAVVMSADAYAYVEQLKKQALKAEIEKGMRSLEEHGPIDGEEVFRKLRLRIDNASV